MFQIKIKGKRETELLGTPFHCHVNWRSSSYREWESSCRKWIEFLKNCSLIIFHKVLKNMRLQDEFITLTTLSQPLKNSRWNFITLSSNSPYIIMQVVWCGNKFWIVVITFPNKLVLPNSSNGFSLTNIIGCFGITLYDIAILSLFICIV